MSINKCNYCEGYFDVEEAPTKHDHGRHGHIDNWYPPEDRTGCPLCDRDITDDYDEFCDGSAIEELNKLKDLADREFRNAKQLKKDLDHLKDLIQNLSEDGMPFEVAVLKRLVEKM